jgi:glutathione S-transferase
MQLVVKYNQLRVRDAPAIQGGHVSLTLHFHPLSSFCWKALIALYENDTPFTPNMVNLGDETDRAALLKLWPIGKFPVLRDDGRDQTVPESSVIIIEYLDRHYPGRVRFIPGEADLAWQTRLSDRFYDLYVHLPMQKMVDDRMRPEVQKDPRGVGEARARIQLCYGMIEQEISTGTWAMGEAFGMADCAASPALFYANKVVLISDAHPKLTAYLDRLMARPAFARVLEEAEPYLKLFPQ